MVEDAGKAMSDPNAFPQSLASSEHIRTLAALMQQRGIDIELGTGETHGGIGYTVVLGQGPYAQLLEQVARAVVDEAARQRLNNKNEAERG